MNIILLSGGSGTRLWPLSNEVRSKQFLKIFRTSGGHESMVQRMYRMLKEADQEALIIIATSQSQVPQIKCQLGERVRISIEPCRRDTFPAIALACAFLKENGTREDEPVVICPIDSYVDKNYFMMVKTLSEETGNANLGLMGITPTYPSTKYGYILPGGKFIEKPSEEKAKELIKEGALWNGGVFSFRLGYILKKAEEILGSSDYKYIFNNYSSLKKISFDYAVAEHEDSVYVLPFSGEWRDLGTWNTLTEVMEEQVSGNATAVNCDRTHIINELNIPLVAMGAEDMVVAATADGILVSKKDMSTQLKNYIGSAMPMHETRLWGNYTVLENMVHQDGSNSITKHLIITPGKYISYQRHKQRTEIWIFIEGEGELVIDGSARIVKRGDSVVIPAGIKHAVKALDKDLHIIEVQAGNSLEEEDIERFDWIW